MLIQVLLASGETDSWHDATDATLENGALHILQQLPIDGSVSEEEVARLKTVRSYEEIDNGPDAPPGTLSRLHRLCGTYAPGMWMKVVYQ